MDTVEIIFPDNFHAHVREKKNGDGIFEMACKQEAMSFKRSLIMPNLHPHPVLTGKDVKRYKEEILSQMESYHLTHPFEPLMTVQLTDQEGIKTTPRVIEDAYRFGAIAAKIYPAGVTTNSSKGVKDIFSLMDVFVYMRDLGMILCVHPESPEAFVLDREDEYLKIIEQLIHQVPGLKIVLEHITTKKSIEFVKKYPNQVAATITVHHLFITLDDVIGGMINPHNFCKPIAKYPHDRKALIQVVMEGHPNFFAGNDSAPHIKDNKECAHGCAGIFNTPVTMALLAQLFEQEGKLSQLENFTSVFGATFYGLNPNTERVTLIKKPWTVPALYGSVVPFKAGEILSWQVKTS